MLVNRRPDSLNEEVHTNASTTPSDLVAVEGAESLNGLIRRQSARLLKQLNYSCAITALSASATGEKEGKWGDPSHAIRASVYCNVGLPACEGWSSRHP